MSNQAFIQGRGYAAMYNALRAIVDNEDSGRTETRWTAKDDIAEPGALANLDAARAALAEAEGQS